MAITVTPTPGDYTEVSRAFRPPKENEFVVSPGNRFNVAVVPNVGDQQACFESDFLPQLPAEQGKTLYCRITVQFYER